MSLRVKMWVCAFASMYFTIVSTSMGMQAGDLIVLCSDAIYGHTSVVDINPSTGQQSVISSGGLLHEPDGVAVDSQGNILVSDYGGNFGGSQGSIIRINPVTGQQTLVASGGYLVFPSGIAIDSSGNIITCPTTTSQASAMVVRINPVTGAQTLVANGSPLKVASGLTIGTDGNYYVSNWQDNGVGGTNIERISPTTGAQTVVWTGYSLYGAQGLCNDTLHPGNMLLAFAPYPDTNPSVLDVNTATGSTAVVSQNGIFNEPYAIAEDRLGDIFLTNETSTYVGSNGSYINPGAVVEVNATTGAQTIIASNLDGPSAIAFATVPEPSCLTVLCTAALFAVRRNKRRVHISRHCLANSSF